MNIYMIYVYNVRDKQSKCAYICLVIVTFLIYIHILYMNNYRKSILHLDL